MKYFGLAALAGALGTVAALALPDGYGLKHGPVKPGPAVEYTFPAKLPAVKCGHQLLVGCNPQHSVIPCNAHAPAPAPHYPAPASAPKAHYKAASETQKEAAPEPMVEGKHKHKKHHKHHHFGHHHHGHHHHGHHHHGHHHHGHHNKFHHHHHHHHHHHRH